MMDEGGPVRRLVKIYEAPSAFEAALIRRTLAGEGIECMIPGEDMHASPAAGSEENAIFVREEERDRALRLLQRAWEFFEGSGGGENVLEDD
jgi:hypothetical protein